MKKIQGKIIINAYKRPIESVRQAERLQSEFSLIGVETEIISDQIVRAGVNNGKIFTNLKNSDFIIYLDKDKYTSAVLNKLGVKTFNSHHSIRICDDKAETYIALSNSGLNLPKTLFGVLSYSEKDQISNTFLDAIEKELKYPVIVKECFGSMGKGVFIAKNRVELIELYKQVKSKPHLFQEYLSYKKGADVRVIVIGGKAISAIERYNPNDFRSNVALGGSAKAVELSEEFKNSAETCAKVLGLDYCGVDLIYGDNCKPFVCEVNSNAFFEGTESATKINVAKIYAEYVLSKLN